MTAAIAATLVIIARDNDRGLVPNGIIRLDTSDATIFYWVLAGSCALGCGIALLMIVHAFGAAQEVSPDRSAISAPKSLFSGTNVTVRHDRITDLRLTKFKS